MHKTFTGTVVSTKMKDTVIVEVYRKKPHPMYGKLLKRSKKFKVALNNHTVSEGDSVIIEETRPVAKGKYFQIIEVLQETHTKTLRKESSNDTAKK
jgi:small subunit ribosomal protein S17